MSLRRSAGLAAVPLAAAALALAGCAGARPADPDALEPGVPVRGVRGEPVVGSFGTLAAIYRRMGLLAPAAPVPFVGTVRFLGTARPADSTLALVAVSLPNRALTFVRDGDRFRASYEVRAEVRRGAQVVRRVEAEEVVRVASVRETTRGDESVIFQQTLALAPGPYTLSVAVRDGAGVRNAAQELAITVPTLAGGTLSSPVTVYEAAPRAAFDSAPRLVASPRATFTFGRDTAASVYLEGYGPGGATLPVRLTLRAADGGAPVWSGAVSLARRGALFSGVVPVPLAALGVGRVGTLVAARADSRDSVAAPLFVTFGDELPLTSFDEMTSYLRYFADGPRVAALRRAPAAGRGAAWGEFFRATDPTPSTPGNEALREYFARIAQANARYREEGGSGWLTDRGRVYVSVGDPDQLYEQGGTADVNARGRAQIWEYRDDGVRLVFFDQSGFGRWRLSPQSEGDLQLLARRRGPPRGGS